MDNTLKGRNWSLWSGMLVLALLTVSLPTRVVAQGQGPQDDPPTRVARLAYMEGSVSMQPAGQSDWVQAAPNRPMTIGDNLWADKASRAELQLGSAVIRVSENTSVSFLNLDDHTVQLQLSAGVVNVRVRRLNQGDTFEVDTPNLAFTISDPGSYRLEASEDGNNTVVALRAGDGEATGNGQTYTLHAGQRGTFSGTTSLNADVEQISPPDPFDSWADGREHRYEASRSTQYLSPDVVGFDDLDDSGDWRGDPSYGHVWFPHVAVGWAPYHTGHWAWIDPWGYTWVDDSPWGYAPFHYGRWVSVGGTWGWIPGPPAAPPVYAPALVVFVGGGGFGANVGWFPLGPREVYVPTYPVSPAYVNQVNISNTNVNTTTVTNVYNTTIINKTTVNNITYVNKTVPGAVTAVPQNAFASAQPVAKAAVPVNAQMVASAAVTPHVAVNPTRAAVLGPHAATAGHVTAPSAAIMNRQVVAKKTPPPPPVPFTQRLQAMAAHPGQPLPKHQVATLRPASPAKPLVKVAPPGKPATPTVGHPPAKEATATPPGKPAPAPPAKSAPPPPAKPAPPPPAKPAPPPAKPAPAPPKPESKPAEAHPPAKPAETKPAPKPPEHPPAPKPENKPEANRPPAAKPEAAPKKPPEKPQTPEEKKKQEEEQKRPPGE